MSCFIFCTLRTEGVPLSTTELTRRFLAARGMDEADGERARTAARRMAMALRRQELLGMLRAKREPGRPVLWAMAP